MGQADVRRDLVAGGEGSYEGVEGVATRVSYEMFGRPGTRVRPTPQQILRGDPEPVSGQPRNRFCARPLWNCERAAKC